MAPSPPKPWERSSAPSAAASTLTTSSSSSSSSPATSTSSVPALPDRPATMTTTTPAATTTAGYGTTSALSPYSAATASPYSSTAYNRYGATGYGGMGSYGGLGSYGGGYGGYGSMGYGSIGMGGYGMGGYGGGMNSFGGGYGMGGMGGYPLPGSPEELSLSQRMEHGTAATFQMIQAIVGAFGGFAQMLESTFMATHSSFFAMIGVAEQFGHLRNYLGQVLSIFALVRWIKGMLYRLTGRTPPTSISASEFKAFEGGAAGGANGQPPKPKLAKKPLFVFLLTVIGLPWLMNRLVRLITERQAAEAARIAAAGGPQAQQPQFDQFGRPLPPQPIVPAAPLDPSQLLFMRALHSYTPPPESAEKELTFEKDEIIAVLSTKEEREKMGWWMGRKRDGKVGWVPGNWLGEIPGMGATTKKIEEEKTK
ncbi:hypothetical protein JCM3765_003755 [Sporobolomyces pararoseus]